jgi:hypothetical protein
MPNATLSSHVALNGEPNRKMVASTATAFNSVAITSSLAVVIRSDIAGT